MLNVELTARTQKSSSQRRILDIVKEDMWRVGVTEDLARNEVRWRQIIDTGSPKME